MRDILLGMLASTSCALIGSGVALIPARPATMFGRMALAAPIAGTLAFLVQVMS